MRPIYPARKRGLRALACAALVGSALGTVVAQPTDSTQQATDAARRAQQRDEALRERLQPNPDVRLPSNQVGAGQRRLPADESPCFVIEHVRLSLSEPASIALHPLRRSLAGAHSDDSPEGRCLGAKGIELLIARVQDALIQRGYLTSRVFIEQQDLASGQLQLRVMIGRIGGVRLDSAQDARATLANALPMRAGDVLNLRDVEQALENLKRVPTAEADIQIAPGSEPGTSDVVVRWSQGLPFRVLFSADDSGSSASGKYQGSATLSYDHAFTLNDLLYVTLARDLGGSDSGHRGTRGLTTHYSVPLGYWLLSLNASRNRYFQSVAGATQDYVYSGISHNQDIKLTHLLHRDAVSKTSWSLKAFARQSENYIDDTEIEVQRRRVGGYELGLQHKAQWGSSQMAVQFAFRRGTWAFGANEAPEEMFGEGTHQFRMLTADVTWSRPFEVGAQRWQWQSNWRWQHNRTPLTPQDRFSIGGRYTVRGFDGISTLSAERGWLLRNELSTALPQTEQHVYLALDHGEVDGASARQLLGQRLTGWAAGLRGRFGAVSYDVFVGAPIRKPRGFQTASTTAGISLSAEF